MSAVPAAAATTPTITAVGPVTPAKSHPGVKATAKYTVSVPVGASVTNGYIFFSESSPLYTASNIPLSASIAGCQPVTLSPSSASNALACQLPALGGGSSYTFTYSAPLPVDTGSQVSFSAELADDLIPNSQLGWLYYGTASVSFTYGPAVSTKPGIASFIAPVSLTSVTTAVGPLAPPPPVVAVNKPWRAVVVVTGYNATVSGLEVKVTAPPGTTMAATNLYANPASSFTCGPQAGTTIICTGGTLAAATQASWLLSGTAPKAAGSYALSVVADPGDTAPPGVVGAPAASANHLPVSSTLPDLQVTAAKPSVIYAGTPFTETFTVTNTGTAPALNPTLTVLTSQYASSVTAPGFTCADTQVGHSGRGGGYTHTGYACTTLPGTTLGAGAHLAMTASVLLAHPTALTQTVTASTSTVQLDNLAHALIDMDSAVMPAPPTAPSGVLVSQSGDSLLVAWIPGTAGGASFTTTVTATPAAGLALSTVVSGSSGSAAISGVQPATGYTITVVSSDAAGAGPGALPVTFTTNPSTTPPGPPVITRVAWNTATELIAAWSAPAPGDSPITDYQVTAAPYPADPGAPPPVVVDAGTTLAAAVFVSDSTLDWSITVRALNAAGWGPWSAPQLLGGL